MLCSTPRGRISFAIRHVHGDGLAPRRPLALPAGQAFSSTSRALSPLPPRPDPLCHLAAIYQTSPGALRDAATARRLAAILEEHGCVLRLPAATVVDGAPRRDAWELVP